MEIILYKGPQFKYVEAQENVNIEKRKKATFEMDSDLHRKLRRYAAHHENTMIKIVERALNDYLNVKSQAEEIS